MLLGRRKRYDPADGGHHELWMSVGGSAGHSGLWALNIDEGTRQDPGGRRWDVEVLNAHEAYDQRAEAEAERGQLRKERQRQSQRDRDEDAVLAALALFPEGETRNTLRDAAGLSGRRFGPILAHLMAKGLVEQCEITKPNGQRYTAFRRGTRTLGHSRTTGLSD